MSVQRVFTDDFSATRDETPEEVALRVLRARRVRLEVAVPYDLRQRLLAEARARGTTMSALAEAALEAFLPPGTAAPVR